MKLLFLPADQTEKEPIKFTSSQQTTLHLYHYALVSFLSSAKQLSILGYDSYRQQRTTNDMMWNAYVMPMYKKEVVTRQMALTQVTSKSS